MKKFILPATVIFSLLAFFIQGCYYDNEAELHPESFLETACDTALVTFSGSIQPVLKSYCGTNNSCHGTNNTSNIQLNNYAGVKAQADNGRLWQSVSWTGSASFMPKNSSAKLNDCLLAKLNIWIQNGAPNN